MDPMDDSGEALNLGRYAVGTTIGVFEPVVGLGIVGALSFVDLSLALVDDPGTLKPGFAVGICRVRVRYLRPDG